MFLFPVDGLWEIILSYGQTISLFLVFVVFEGLIAARSEKPWPGLIFIGLIVLLAIALWILFDDFAFFVFMIIPAFLCIPAFILSRRTRAKNIAKGMKYNEDGLIEDELRKMQNGN